METRMDLAELLQIIGALYVETRLSQKQIAILQAQIQQLEQEKEETEKAKKKKRRKEA